MGRNGGKMKVENYKIMNFWESLLYSGLPMMSKYDEKWIKSELANLSDDLNYYHNPHYKRACRLAKTAVGSGHNNFLSGIMVSLTITATVKWWEQFQRYHFKQIVSSMSTMHRIRQMMDEGTIKFNPKTDKSVIEKFMELVKDESVTDEQLAYSCPMGIELTAHVTTNYLQLRTMWEQRHNHRLEEWREFCMFIGYLPFAPQLIVPFQEIIEE